MKKKKIIFTTALVLCTGSLLVFTFGFFPSILATAPGYGGVVTITQEEKLPAETIGYPGETDEKNGTAEMSVQPGGDTGAQAQRDGEETVSVSISLFPEASETQSDINAISAKQAAEIALDLIGDHERIERLVSLSGRRTDAARISISVSGHDTAEETHFGPVTYYDAGYFESADPFSDPFWIVLFTQEGPFLKVTTPELPDGNVHMIALWNNPIVITVKVNALTGAVGCGDECIHTPDADAGIQRFLSSPHRYYNPQPFPEG